MTSKEAIKHLRTYSSTLGSRQTSQEQHEEAKRVAIENLEKTRWIPIAERLPENAKHKGAFCPKYYVMTEYGATEGWYNPDVKCWYVLLWFMDGQFEEWNINLDRGDVPKLVKNVPVIAWMPLPKTYREVSE